jgi:hypothetical protein
MSLDELKKQFLVDDEVGTGRLEQLLSKALPHCVVDKKGTVHLKSADLSGKEQVKLVLAGRLIASKLEAQVSGEVTVDQLAEYTGLPKNQAAARAKECLDEKFAERSVRGSYKARVHKLEQFLDGLPPAKNTQRAS